VQKYCKREPRGGESGVGVEVVTEKEFVRRKRAVEERAAPVDPYSWGMITIRPLELEVRAGGGHANF
jgi:hypothetical protein